LFIRYNRPKRIETELIEAKSICGLATGIAEERERKNKPQSACNC
jgi:hypothetical protein